MIKGLMVFAAATFWIIVNSTIIYTVGKFCNNKIAEFISTNKQVDYMKTKASGFAKEVKDLGSDALLVFTSESKKDNDEEESA